MLGSLERIGGTPAILWGLGVARKGKQAAAALKAMTGELSRRAAISFPDEDVLVATRLVAAELLRVARELREPRAASRLRPERRRPRVGPPPGEAVRARPALRRSRLHRRGEEPQADVRADPRREPGEGNRWREGRLARRRLDATRGKAMIAFGWAVAEELAAGSYVAAY